MACCDWETFEEAFRAAWRRAKRSPSPLLVDWDQARLYWDRYHCTGFEAARVQLTALDKEGEFLIIEQLNRHHEDVAVDEARPHTPVAAKLLADELLARFRLR